MEARGNDMTREDRISIMEIFSALGEELAEDVIKHRKAKKCELTSRGARSLMREYEATGNAIAAAEEHLNRGWQGFKAEWIKKPSGFIDSNNPYQKPENNNERAKRFDLMNQYRFARDEGNHEKAAQLRAQLN
jgi:hypothetical protein